MLEKNQNSNNLNALNNDDIMEQPAVISHEDTVKNFDVQVHNISDRADFTNFKDLEISFNFEKIELIKKLLEEVQNNLRRISFLLGEDTLEITEKIKHDLIEGKSVLKTEGILAEKENQTLINKDVAFSESGERIIEGVFNGQNMIGDDGKEYIVPANYASKSKLVEGDILKLTINARGNFIFKQIGPIERLRVIGVLEESETGGYCVRANNKRWRVLTAPVTYFKGKSGDEAIILIPKNTPSKWAAVENIIKKSE